MGQLGKLNHFLKGTTALLSTYVAMCMLIIYVYAFHRPTNLSPRLTQSDKAAFGSDRGNVVAQVGVTAFQQQQNQPEIFVPSQQQANTNGQEHPLVSGYNQPSATALSMKQAAVRNNIPTPDNVTELQADGNLGVKIALERIGAALERMNTRTIDAGLQQKRTILQNGNDLGIKLPETMSSSLKLPLSFFDQMKDLTGAKVAPVDSQQPSAESPTNMTGLKTNLETKQTDNSVFDKKPVQPATNQLQTDIYKHINTSIGKKSVLPIPTIGEWVPGNRYEQTCAFFQEGHICCGENVTKMHFEFLSDIKNSESALSEFVSKTKGKTIVIFGDSIQKNFYLGLVDVLKLGKF